MKTVFIGCVDFSAAMLESVMASAEADVIGIVTRQSSPVNADFCDLAPLAKNGGVDYLHIDGNDQAKMATWIREKKPDIIFCCGWSYLLGAEILDIPAIGVVGYHPTTLPANRGRHPLIWTLVLGLDEAGSTFFMMDEAADSGDILSQARVPVAKQEDAASLYQKIIKTAAGQISEMIPRLADGTHTTTPQDHRLATEWRKRGRKDGEIDWRMSAPLIGNLVRALNKPYPGAHFNSAAGDVKVWSATVATDAPANAEPGKVLAVDGRKITVKTGDQAIVLVDHELSRLPQVGEYL